MPDMSFSQNDRGALDFIQQVKATEVSQRTALAREEYAELRDAWRQAHGREPASMGEVAEVMSRSGAYAMDRAMWRFTQEQMYGRIRESLWDRRGAFEAFLNAPVANPVGSLTLDPALDMPWYFEADFHLQPGGMWKEPLVPFVTRISNDVFSGGRSKSFEFQAGAAAAIPPGRYGKILDMACGFKSPIVIKQRFPEAEVYGCDLSGPLVQFGFKLSESMGLPIHWSQQNCERMTFPDNTFDVVFNTILYHELPNDATMNCLREAQRVLKPGGLYVQDDSPTYNLLDALGAYESDWMTTNNAEPFWNQAGNRDYAQLLRMVGFRDLAQGVPSGDPKSKSHLRIHKAVK
jgi:ubiquinone/menaquinone biosynthesis C-methylase UbiE